METGRVKKKKKNLGERAHRQKKRSVGAKVQLGKGDRDCNTFPKSTDVGKIHTEYIFFNIYF